MKPIALFILMTSLVACQADETVAGYGGAGHVWHLNTINGAVFSSRATLEFSANDTIVGQAPCNRYSTRQTAPYPWFKITEIASTKMACPDLADEILFFGALKKMALSESSGDVLILSTQHGDEMIFTP